MWVGTLPISFRSQTVNPRPAPRFGHGVASPASETAVGSVDSYPGVGARRHRVSCRPVRGLTATDGGRRRLGRARASGPLPRRIAAHRISASPGRRALSPPTGGVATDTSVPYVRVQHVDTTRGPVERAIGLASVVVYTAGTRGADITIPGLRPVEPPSARTTPCLANESEATDAGEPAPPAKCGSERRPSGATGGFVGVVGGSVGTGCWPPASAVRCGPARRADVGGSRWHGTSAFATNSTGTRSPSNLASSPDSPARFRWAASRISMSNRTSSTACSGSQSSA